MNVSQSEGVTFKLLCDGVFQMAAVDMALLAVPPIPAHPDKSISAQILAWPSPSQPNQPSLSSHCMLSPWPLNFTRKHDEYFYPGHTILTPQQLFFILWLTLTSGVKAMNGPTTKAVLF